MKHIQEFDAYREGMDNDHSHEMENYMFFQNLHTMKREIESMLAMDHDKVNSILHDGHGWALDHIATSADDILEVSNFLKNSVDQEEAPEMPGEEIMMVTNLEAPAEDAEEVEEADCPECGSPMTEGKCQNCY